MERDNHEPRQRGAAARAGDLEQHAGVESLVGWIKRECLDEIKGAASWAELHQVMRDNGLALRARGNGLVIEAGDGTIIKASTLARDLSKPALEKRLGAFEASPEHQAAPARRSYQKGRPMRLRGGLDTTELYARYKGAQQNLTAARAGVLAEAKRRKDRAIENAKKAAATRRAAIKHLTDGRLTKKLLYAQASAALRADLDAIHKRHDQERAAIYNEHRRRPWADWLKQQATAGDGQALDALRAREAAQGLKGDTIQGDGQAKPGHAPVIDSITKKGTIIYRAGSSAVRDDGERLAVSSQADRAGVAAALRLAMERYGERITVSGSVEFKAAVIRAASMPSSPSLSPIRHWKAGGRPRPPRPRPSAGQACPLLARNRRRIAGTACAHSASSTRCASRARPSGRRKRRPRPPRRRRRPKCSSRPGPRRPSLNSVRRGYGRRWKPRRPNARRARSAGDDACEFSDVRLASELAARSYIAAS
ncbi:relaxase/mobilization nuclease domain-containing protein [Morganella morganii]|nr:relaxase/mobilization nuclease domain-containing protein [Morganella morganii]